VENGIHKLTFVPEKKRPVKDYFKGQGRFRHLTEEIVKQIQERVDLEWERLLKKCD